MMINGKHELITGLCLGAFGAYVAFQAFKLPYVSEYGPGPGFFPLWIGVGLAALSVLLILAKFFTSPVEDPSARQSWWAAGRALSGWLGLMIAIALVRWLGFALSLALLTSFLILALERRPLRTALSVAFALALGFHIIFAVALGLSLPAGPWGF